MTNEENLTVKELFADDVQGFYDTNTGTMFTVKAEDLQNIDFITEVLENKPSLAVIFGSGDVNTLDEVSSFVGGPALLDYIDSKQTSHVR